MWEATKDTLYNCGEMVFGHLKVGCNKGMGGATCEDSSKDVRVMFNNNNNTKEKVMDSWCMS